MRTKLLFEDFDAEKPWAIVAIEQELRRSTGQLWKGEPGEEGTKEERLKRISFLRKLGRSTENIAALNLAERLENCCRRYPCLSGACPQCARLFQRAWVRHSKKVVSSMPVDGKELVAISLVLPHSTFPQGASQLFNIGNMQRRLKSRLVGAGIDFAIGGIDFSFNEDRTHRRPGLWCPHAYIITATADRSLLGRHLTSFDATPEVPRPKRITPFRNDFWRLSYAMKMHFQRRIGYNDCRGRHSGTLRQCRNTSRDKLRAAERLELFLLLDRIGFAGRAVFKDLKPIVVIGKYSGKVVFRRITSLSGNRGSCC